MANHSSNSIRKDYRTKCRQKLSEHIFVKLGISVEPADVRLITSADDTYTWQPLAEKAHLFTKHLSKHSVGAYRELCREVGVSFEAVPASRGRPVGQKPLEEHREDINTSSAEISFTSTIEQLQQDKLKLVAELNESNDREKKATELKQLAEEESIRLKMVVHESETKVQKLQDEVQTSMETIEYFRSTTAKLVDDFIGRFAGLKLDLNLLAVGRPSLT